MTITVNIIGAGAVGKTLGRLLVDQQLIKIVAVCNRNLTSTLESACFLNAAHSVNCVSELPAADITCITTPDDCIAAVSQLLSQNKQLKQDSVVFHCSGLLSSDGLEALRGQCFLASIHPLRSFAVPKLSPQEYCGTFCAVEGDTVALDRLKPLFAAIGSICFNISKEQKPLYHAAAVFASNYLVTLAEQAAVCLRQAGLEPELIMRLTTHLMMGTVRNLQQASIPMQALTGPIKRGDLHTIGQHLEALEEKQKKLYTALGLATLDLAPHQDQHSTAMLKQTMEDACS